MTISAWRHRGGDCAIDEHLGRGALDDGLVFDAVRVRLIEIGEAVRAISAELLAREPDIPWIDIAGMRNISRIATSIPLTQSFKRLSTTIYPRSRLPSNGCSQTTVDRGVFEFVGRDLSDQPREGSRLSLPCGSVRRSQQLLQSPMAETRIGSLRSSDTSDLLGHGTELRGTTHCVG